MVLHPKKIYLQHFKNGVYFLGVFIKPYRIYIGKKTKHNFYESIREWNKVIIDKGGVLEEDNISKFLSSTNSYLGIMKHYNTLNLRKRITTRAFTILWAKYFYVEASLNKFVSRLPKDVAPVAEQSRAEQSRAEQSRADNCLSLLSYHTF